MRYLLIFLLGLCCYGADTAVLGNAVLGNAVIGQGAAVWSFDSTSFNGTSQRLSRGAALDNLADDGQVGTISVWVKMAGDNFGPVVANNATRFYVRQAASQSLQFRGYNSSGTQVMLLQTYSLPLNEWVHVLASWDLSTAGRYYVYTNGVQSGLQSTTFTAGGTIDYVDASSVNFYIGGNASAQWWSGCLTELWFDDSYTAYSAGFLAKFYSSGNPVNLGADGSTPTGTQPCLYMHEASGAWDNTSNVGSGGAFTVAAGPLSTCSDDP